MFERSHINPLKSEFLRGRIPTKNLVNFAAISHFLHPSVLIVTYIFIIYVINVTISLRMCVLKEEGEIYYIGGQVNPKNKKY